MIEQLLEVLTARGLTVAVAEGDTGGLVLEQLTSIPGSSAVVLGGVVAYHDRLKQSLLHMSSELLASHGAVSQQAAEAMAHGVRNVCNAALGAASTGIAGPGGATPTKPVGLAWLAVTDGQRTLSRQHHWLGTRAENRAQSAQALIALTLEFVQ